jgi:hypothetical protein
MLYWAGNWAGTQFLAVFLVVFLLALPIALVKSRRRRKETRAWLDAEDSHRPDDESRPR